MALQGSLVEGSHVLLLGREEGVQLGQMIQLDLHLPHLILHELSHAAQQLTLFVQA